jgi:DNA-binding NtrC family response regulator
MGEMIDVLVVDEDEEVLDLTSTFLERKSDRIAVETEHHPPTAADRAVEEGFDCVVSDFRMPEMNGMELFETIHERTELPFFLFTAAAGTETGADALDAGVAGFIQKGAGTDHYDELVEGIETAVE